ncbi:FecR family protein [Rheinheimera maricola]|uniref:FecR family protein n=1 Tax=Rheinheimera maricola TaxID=2793282 RepID=A0ABS7X5T2_9GAMM|nr:FecR family protein [Rheinheimera maricola]MBZ9610505.1 FecR family protein [Rheinheimera maricola]
MHSKNLGLLCCRLASASVLGLGISTSPLQADTSTSSAAAVGKTIMAKGIVAANDQQQSRALKRLSPVYKVDLVSTGPASSSQMRMIDGGLLSLQADSELAIGNYQFNQDGLSDVDMTLLKGGLRTITGALPANQKTYKLNTPIATIGVRGTHYEAILQQGDLYLAGWDGSIDIQVTVPGANQRFSLGPEQAYRFAIVRADGTVELLLRTPPLFAAANIIPLIGQSRYAGEFDIADTIKGEAGWLIANGALALDASGRDFYDNEQVTAGWSLQGLDSISRSGIATFDQLSNHSFSSTAGSLSDLSMSMEIDFDGAWVPSGQLSFTDAGGEWFAIFNGVFGEKSLELFVNFASHGNELADGTINALLIDDATKILGNLSLFELDNPSVRVEGGFELSELP